MRIPRDEVPWLALVASSLAAGLAASWQRWGSPLVDCGREMNQPLRLLAGERLYADVAHLYGPLAPHLNAVLYWLFAPHLSVLVGHGLVVTTLIVGLTYWIARQIMGRPESALAAIGITWLCALKPSGNYVLPYAYAALDACGLGLVALALAMRFLQTGGVWTLCLASGAAGLACLAKIEIGTAAGAVVVIAAWLGARSPRERAVRLAASVLPAASLVAVAYGLLAAGIGWNTLARESYLLTRDLPPALVFYNKRMFGLDHPLESLLQMSVLAIRMALVAALVCWAALATAGAGRDGAAAAPACALRRARLWAAALAALSAVTALLAGWDKGPFLAVPFLLAGLLAFGLIRARRGLARFGRVPQRSALLVLLAAFALTTLARTMLRVRSGGAYSSFLLPVGIILFIYAWAHILPLFVRGAAARRAVRRIALGVLFLWIGATALVTAYRYDRHFRYVLTTPRGTMRVLPVEGVAFDQALAFILERTRPGDTVLVMPEGSALDFFTDRKNPLNEEITTPGLLDEERALIRLEQTRTPLVLFANRTTIEFGASVLGRDYHQRIVAWIADRYEVCGLFGRDVRPNAQIGDRGFFFRAYCLRSRD
jgi:hypothetical protein